MELSVTHQQGNGKEMAKYVTTCNMWKQMSKSNHGLKKYKHIRMHTKALTL